MYNEKVMEIFKNPHNVGELKDANAVGQVGNVACGDIMKIFLKINDNEVIEDASFKTFGCAAAIVSSSIATDLIKGMTIKEALELDNDKIIEIAGGLPVHKIHCSVLAKEAIEDAVNNYYKRKAKEEKLLKEGKLKPKKEPKKAKEKITEDKVIKEDKNEEVKETVVKQEQPAEQKLEAKSLLSSLKSIKETKTTEMAKVQKETELTEKNKKEVKKEQTEKNKSAKKIDKNFKNLSARLNKLNK